MTKYFYEFVCFRRQLYTSTFKCIHVLCCRKVAFIHGCSSMLLLLLLLLFAVSFFAECLYILIISSSTMA